MDCAALADVRQVGNGNDVQHAPDVIRTLSFRNYAELFTDPRMSAVSAKDVLGMDDLPMLWRVSELTLLVAGELTIESVFELVAELFWLSILVGELFDGDSNGVGGLVLGFALVDDEGLGDDGSLNFEGVARKLVYGVSKPLLYPALVDYGAIEARDSNNALNLAGDFVNVAICVRFVIAGFYRLLGSSEPGYRCALRK